MDQGNGVNGGLAARLLWAIACMSLGHACLADTLHSIADGAFQHHGSSWIFPEKIGEFTRVGVPQDVDGTIDVVAYYAAVIDGVRITAIVDVFPPDSAAAGAKLDDAKALYYIDTGAWIVRIRSETPTTDPASAALLDNFVRGQRWDSLARNGELEPAAAPKLAPPIESRPHEPLPEQTTLPRR